MLVLTREVNEVVMLTFPDGTLAEIMVVHISPEKVRLGFTAPASVVVDRLEIWELKQAEKLDPPPAIA